jgi:endonuclease YncB( thermonuclease family)
MKSNFIPQLLIAVACWTVSGTPLRTVDGDTFRAELEIWQGIKKIETVRLLGIDTPELRGPDRARALEAKAFTAAWLGKDARFTLMTCGRDSLGRVLGEVTRGEENLADLLLKSGHAKIYKARR